VIVVDASVICDYILNAEIYPELVDFVAAQERLSAPTLIEYEVGSVVRRLNLAGKLSSERAESALNSLHLLQLELYEAGDLLIRAWQLRANISFYDATYVALAESIGQPLYTRDKRLANAPGHIAHIILL
jgi:predicted nucleic acid-binding protein